MEARSTDRSKGKPLSSRLWSAVRLVRPVNTSAVGVLTLVGATLTAVGFGSPGRAVGLAFASSLLTSGGAHALNDYQDRRKDRDLYPDRPLPRGGLSPTEVLVIAVVHFFLALLLVSPLGPLPLSLVLLAITLILGYELRWKKRGFVGNAIVGLLGTGPLFLGGVVSEGIQWTHVLLALPLMVGFTGHEIVRDIEHRKGDRDRMTLARTRGAAYAGRRASEVFTIAAVLIFLPASMRGFGRAFLPISIVVALLLLAAGRASSDHPGLAQRMTKLGAIVGLGGALVLHASMG